jgi:DNA-binding FadR family transcriptional regulator
VSKPRTTKINPTVQRRDGHNLTYGIVHDLGTAIVIGTFAANKPFPIEAELCERYGASRSVLREAVKMLTAKGLLRARPRQGTSVAPEQQWNLLDPDVIGWLLERQFSLDLLAEFTEVRLAIEPAAAALAAERASPNQRAQIMTTIERMRAAEHGRDDPLDSDIAFHVAVLEASGNRFLMQMRDLIAAALRSSIRTTNHYKGVRLASVIDHKKVADAIVAGNAVRAKAAMRALLEEAQSLIEKGRASTRRGVQAARRRA